MTTPLQDPTASVTPSIVRTIVPFLVGLLVTWLASRGLGLDTAMQANLTAVVTVFVGSVYYSVVRLLEKNRPKAGILLGMAKSPSYDATTVTELENQLIAAYLREISKDSAVAELQVANEGLAADLVAAKAPKKRAPRKAAATKKNAAVVDAKDEK